MKDQTKKENASKTALSEIGVAVDKGMRAGVNPFVMIGFLEVQKSGVTNFVEELAEQSPKK